MSQALKPFGLQKVDKNVTENRNIYVGGSDVPTILGINKYKSQFELAKEKTGIQPSQFTGNEYTAFGNALEPQIRDYINAINDTHFIVDTTVNEEKHIRSNVDGVDYEEGLLLEIKTHGKHPTLAVYEAQMQLYMDQLGLDFGWLALYERPDNFDIEFDRDRLEIKEIKRDEVYVQKIYDAIETFWIRCEYLKENPDMTEQEYLSTGTDMDVAISRLNKVAPQLEKLRKQIKEYEETEKEVKKVLYEKMTENDIKQWKTPQVTVTRILPKKQHRFDSTRFKKDRPELYEDYVKESETKGYVTLKFHESNT